MSTFRAMRRYSRYVYDVLMCALWIMSVMGFVMFLGVALGLD